MFIKKKKHVSKKRTISGVEVFDYRRHPLGHLMYCKRKVKTGKFVLFDAP